MNQSILKLLAYRVPFNFDGDSVMLTAARKVTVYHGTSSKLARSVLKQGLVPGRTKVWDSAISNLESYQGVYVSVDVGVALESAQQAVKSFGGQPLLVSAEVTLGQQQAVDEDHLRVTFNTLYEYAKIGPYRPFDARPFALLRDWDRYAPQFVDKFVEIWLKDIEVGHLRRARTIFKRARQLIADYLKASVTQRGVAKALELNAKGKKWWDRGGPVDDPPSPPDWLWDYRTGHMSMTIDEARSDLRKKEDKLAKTLGRLASAVGLIENQVDGWVNFRVPQIGYRGANRIKSVIELVGDAGSPDKYSAQVYYSNSEQSATDLIRLLDEQLGKSVTL